MLFQLVLLLLVIDVSQTADIQFESEMLKAHNEYRKKHDSPPMSLSIDVCIHTTFTFFLNALMNLIYDEGVKDSTDLGCIFGQ